MQGHPFDRRVRGHIRDEGSLEAAIAKAKQGKKGHVYIANLRLSPLGDLSEDNPWFAQNRPYNESDSAKRIEIGLEVPKPFDPIKSVIKPLLLPR